MANVKQSRVLVGNTRLTRFVVASQLRMFPLPNGLRYRHEVINGVSVDIIEPSNFWPKRRILYLHGGGYILGSPRTHRGFAARLALACKAAVWLPDYRLAPKSPYPAALDDVAAVWQVFNESARGCERIVGGDSAGGGLSLALSYRLQQQNAELPDKLYLLSPWLDLTHSGDSHQSCAELDPMITTDWIEQDCAAQYVGSHPRTDPHISPLFGDPTGLPPIYIQVGTHEILLDDSRRFVAKAKDCGVEVHIEYGEGLWHVWPITAPFSREGANAIKQVGRWADADPAFAV